jgi:PEP-CTERM motif
MKKRTSMLFASAFLALAGSAGAAVIVTGSANDTGFTVSNSDLLQTQMTGGNSSVDDLLTINTGENGVIAGTVGKLTDGEYLTDPDGRAGGLVISGGTITFNLNTSVNTLGYSIDNISVFSGWSNVGREGINVQVFYATVAAPASFVSLGSYTAGFGWASDGIYKSVAYTDNASPFYLAEGVKSIRFDFSGGQENGGSGYKELDVTGIATVPEPSAALLGGLGMLGLLRRRRA